MPAGSFIIFASDETCHIASPGAMDEVRAGREAQPAQIAADIAEKLRSRGYQGQGLLLAIPSSWCLCATISTKDLPRQERAAMAFRLEEKLPLPAENFTADFVSLSDRALGVCAPNDKVRPLVDALEKSGVVVASVSPAAMLAAQELSRRDARITSEAARRNPSKHKQLLLWGEDRRINLISLHNAKPLAWALTESDPNLLAMQLDLTLMEMGDDVQIATCELDESITTVLQEKGLEFTDQPQSLITSVSRLAHEVISGSISPWFELRRGAMAVEDPLRAVRRSLNGALAAAAILCFVLAGAFLYRSVRYDHLAQSDERSLADEFKKEFPSMTLPQNPQATLLSEKKKLLQSGASALPAQAQQSALRIMHDVLAQIRPDADLKFDSMAFNDSSIKLEGTSRSAEDANALIAAARAVGMEPATPRIQKDPAGRWIFFIEAAKPSKSPLAEGRN